MEEDVPSSLAVHSLPSARLQQRAMGNLIIYPNIKMSEKRQRTGSVKRKKAELFHYRTSAARFHTILPLYMFTQACREQRPTTVELQLVVEIVQLLLDV